MPVDEVSASTDATCQRLVENLRSALGEKLLQAEIQRNDVIVRVDRSAWVETFKVCKEKLGFSYFCFLSGLDWLDNPAQTTRYENVWGAVEDEADSADDDAAATEEASAPDAPAEAATEEAAAGYRTGLAGGESRFQVFARLTSLKDQRGIVIKADLDDSDPRIPTISGVYGGADWHEREAWEMFGFWIEGHPNLIHLYLPGAFEGYPLRKDFPLLAREVKPWPGLTNVEPMAGEEAEEGAQA